MIIEQYDVVNTKTGANVITHRQSDRETEAVELKQKKTMPQTEY